MSLHQKLSQLKDYNYYSNKIQSLIETIASTLKSENPESLFLERFETLLVPPLTAVQAYQFLKTVNALLNTPSIYSKPIARERSIALLDGACAIEFFPLVNLADSLSESGAYINLTALKLAEKVTPALLTLHHINLTANVWYRAKPYQQPGENSIAVQYNLVVDIIPGNQEVDFDFINHYIFLTQLLRNYPQIFAITTQIISATELGALEDKLRMLNAIDQQTFINNYIAKSMPLPYDYSTYSPALLDKENSSDTNVAVPENIRKLIRSSNLTSDPTRAPEVAQMFESLKKAVNSYQSAKSYRQRAKQTLMEKINRHDVAAVYACIRSVEFRRDSGIDKSHYLGNASLANGCNAFLDEYGAFLKEHTKAKQQLIKAINANSRLIHAIMADDNLYQILKAAPELLAYMYDHTTQKSAFVCAIYENKREDFPPIYILENEILNYDVARLLLDPTFTILRVEAEEKSEEKSAEVITEVDWYRFNERRHHYYLGSILPASALLPRARGRDDIDKLTPEQKHQLIESDIAVGEDFLRTTYKHLFINIINGKSGVAERTSAAVSTRPDLFFIPISNYMLLEPGVANPNYSRYLEFVAALQGYVESVPADYGNSVVFAGIANVSGNHFIAYFIRKNPDGSVRVRTLDPSVQTYESGTRLRNNALADSKDKAIEKLNKIFTHILPGCDYDDLRVPQQILERDCGLNVLQTLKDVLETLGQENALLRIQHDEMVFNLDRLTINGNHYQGTDFSNHTYYYEPAFKIAGECNRAKWTQYFHSVNQRRFYQKDKQENTIFVGETIAEFTEEYSYANNLQAQGQADALDENLSIICGYMIATPQWDVIEKRFLCTLEDPTIEKLEVVAKHIKESMQIRSSGMQTIDDILPATQSLPALLHELARGILYQKVVTALFQRFQHYMEEFRLELNEADDANTIYDRFIKHRKIAGYYAILSDAEKISLKTDVITYLQQYLSALKENYAKILVEHFVPIEIKQCAAAASLEALLARFDNVTGELNPLTIASLQTDYLSKNTTLISVTSKWPSTHSKLLQKARAAIIKYSDRNLLKSLASAIFTTPAFVSTSVAMTTKNHEAVVADEFVKRVLSVTGVAASPKVIHLIAREYFSHKDSFVMQQNQALQMISELRDTLHTLNNSFAGLLNVSNSHQQQCATLIMEIMTATERALASSSNWNGLSFEQFAAQWASQNTALIQYKKQLALQLTKLYRAEDTSLNPLTRAARRGIANLLGLTLSLYPSSKEFVEFEQQVGAVLRKSTVSLTEENLVSHSTQSYFPNTYGRDLTRSLLKQLLEYWQVQRDRKQELSRAMRDLTDLVENLTTEKLDDTALAAIKRLLQLADVQLNGFGSLTNASASEKVFLAIFNTKTISPLQPDRVAAAEFKAEPPLTIQKIEKIINLYTGTEKIDPKEEIYFGCVRGSELGAQDGAPAGLFGFAANKTKNPLVLSLQQVLQQIRARHFSQQADFAIDYTDLKALIMSLQTIFSTMPLVAVKTSFEKLSWALATVFSDQLNQFGIHLPAAELTHAVKDTLKTPTLALPFNDKMVQSLTYPKAATVNNIPPENLIRLATGHLIDANWLVAQHRDRAILMNPYTQLLLPEDEIRDVFAQSKELKSKVELQFDGRVKYTIDNHVPAIATLCNGLYDPNQQGDEVTPQQQAAWSAFQTYLGNLTPQAMDAVKHHTIEQVNADGTIQRIQLKDVFFTNDLPLASVKKYSVPLCFFHHGNFNFFEPSARQAYDAEKGLSAAQIRNQFLCTHPISLTDKLLLGYFNQPVAPQSRLR